MTYNKSVGTTWHIRDFHSISLNSDAMIALNSDGYLTGQETSYFYMTWS